jgi:PTH1 family peptidyl-tRNA hydrolase
MDAEYLLVGLGNPGGEYVRSPHNAGFEVADKARALCRGPRFAVAGDAALSRCRWRGRSFVLLKPLTYMNRSGVEVERWLRRTALPLDRLIVCYDDLDLPFGRVRLRPGGGAGGHHGMESLLEHLGTGEFPRIRIGIKRPEVAKEQNVDFLLTPLTEDLWGELESAAEAAARAALDAVAHGWAAAMNRHNRKKDPGSGGAGELEKE